MRATDEQTTAVKSLSTNPCCLTVRDREALAAVIAELTALREFKSRLASWVQDDISVITCLRELSSRQFQMQGRYDGSISNECKELIKSKRDFTLSLLALAEARK